MSSHSSAPEIVSSKNKQRARDPSFKTGPATSFGISDTIPVHTRHLSLINERIVVIENVNRLVHLTDLSLRQNFIKKIEGLENNKKLVHLDLYLNGISKIEGLQNNPLEFLDLSFNVIRHPSNFHTISSTLKQLYLIGNKIKNITSEFNCLKFLEILELGDNKIRVIENLNGLTNLKQLWLGRNKITKIQGLENLKQLKLLSLPSNRIVKLEGLVPSLEQLYFGHNGIQKVENLPLNVNTLDLAGNPISCIEGFEQMKSLENLWMNDCLLDNLEQISNLQSCKNLSEVYFERNPMSQSNKRYRAIVLQLLPWIEKIDAEYVKPMNIKVIGTMIPLDSLKVIQNGPLADELIDTTKLDADTIYKPWLVDSTPTSSKEDIHENTHENDTDDAENEQEQQQQQQQDKPETGNQIETTSTTTLS